MIGSEKIDIEKNKTRKMDPLPRKIADIFNFKYFFLGLDIMTELSYSRYDIRSMKTSASPSKPSKTETGPAVKLKALERTQEKLSESLSHDSNQVPHSLQSLSRVKQA